MTYKQKRQQISYDYSMGMTIEQLCEKYNYKPGTIRVFTKLKKYTYNPDFFNVDEYDCWIMPTSEEFKLNNYKKSKTD